MNPLNLCKRLKTGGSGQVILTINGHFPSLNRESAFVRSC